MGSAGSVDSSNQNIINISADEDQGELARSINIYIMYIYVYIYIYIHDICRARDNHRLDKLCTTKVQPFK